jgi:hypothetical protein
MRKLDPCLPFFRCDFAPLRLCVNSGSKISSFFRQKVVHKRQTGLIPNAKKAHFWPKIKGFGVNNHPNNFFCRFLLQPLYMVLESNALPTKWGWQSELTVGGVGVGS